MGITYSYVNHDKRQYFSCDLFGGARFSSIGSGPAARALAILLSERGTWGKDRISILGDADPEYSDFQWHGVNIQVEVILMLLAVDGLQWIEATVDDDIIAFEAMCDIAFQLRDPYVTSMFDKKFGAGKWQRKYEYLVKGKTNIWVQKIIETRDRNLKILV